MREDVFFPFTKQCVLLVGSFFFTKNSPILMWFLLFSLFFYKIKKIDKNLGNISTPESVICTLEDRGGVEG